MKGTQARGSENRSGLKDSVTDGLGWCRGRCSRTQGTGRAQDGRTECLGDGKARRMQRP